MLIVFNYYSFNFTYHNDVFRYTASGGWLLISNVVMHSSTPPSQLPVKTSFREISSEQVLLTTSAMNELRRHLSFTQLRFYCSKKQGRTFHVTTAANSSGEAVVQYFSGNTDVRPASCGSFFRMQNDNSRLAGDCKQWGYDDGSYYVCQWGHGKLDTESRLYEHAAFEYVKYNWVLHPSRWECDDYNVGVSSGDFWKVFVR